MWLSRKADIRELKVLQKIEKKQYQDLMLKAQYVRDQQMKKFEQEMQVWRNLTWRHWHSFGSLTATLIKQC